MKKYIALGMLSLLPLLGFSQVHGYLGKKFNISYNPNITSASGYSTDNFHYQINHEFEISRVISRGWEINLAYSRQSGKASTDLYNLKDFRRDLPGGDMRFSNIKLGWSWYYGKYVAPIGGYISLHTRYYTGTVDSMTIIDSDFPSSSMNYESSSFSAMSFGIAMGHKYVFYDVITFDAYLEFNYGFTFASEGNFDEMNKYSAGYSAWSNDLFRGGIKVGYLF